jgi:hypothetical protein
MEQYGQWLAREKEKRLQPLGQEGMGDFSWGSSDADFVDWLYGIQVVGAIKYKVQPADIARLQKWAKGALRIEIVNIYDRFKTLRNRKKEWVPFTKGQVAGLEKKMDEQEGRYE